MKIISPNIPSKVFKSASKRFTNLSFAERCYHIINYLCSPESDRVYPYFITHKWDRQNFRKRTESFRWDECTQKLFHFYKDQFGLGTYVLNLKKNDYILHGHTHECMTKLYCIGYQPSFILVYDQAL